MRPYLHHKVTEAIGYNVTALVITMSHSCYFALYNHTKNEMKKARVFHQDLSVNCLAATLAGLVCDFATNPLWVRKFYHKLFSRAFEKRW